MAGLVPAIHVLLAAKKTWMPGNADKFTQSAQGRQLWPGMTSFSGNGSQAALEVRQSRRYGRFRMDQKIITAPARSKAQTAGWTRDGAAKRSPGERA
jgi:hypothetical protein